jgi:hypothetical protein
MHTGGSKETEENKSLFEVAEDDGGQAFMERMANMSSEGGSCPFMGSSKYKLVKSIILINFYLNRVL